MNKLSDNKVKVLPQAYKKQIIILLYKKYKVKKILRGLISN